MQESSTKQTAAATCWIHSWQVKQRLSAQKGAGKRAAHLGVHDEGPMLYNGLSNGGSRHKQEAHALGTVCVRLHLQRMQGLAQNQACICA